MTKSWRVFAFLGVFFLTGCISIVQVVEMKSKNSGDVKLKLTLAKAVTELAGSQGGSTESFNAEEVAESFKMKGAAKTYEIDNDTESGFMMEYSFSPKSSKDDKESPFFPLVQGNKIVFDFPPLNTNSTETEKEEDQMTKALTSAILGSAKYNLLLKPAEGMKVKSISYFSVDKENNMKIEPIKVGDVYYIEVPLGFWFLSKTNYYLTVELD